MKIQVVEQGHSKNRSIRVDDALEEALATTDTYCTDNSCFQTQLSLAEVSGYLNSSRNVWEFRHRFRAISELSQKDYSLVQNQAGSVKILGDNVRNYLNHLQSDSRKLFAYKALYKSVKSSPIATDKHTTLESNAAEREYLSGVAASELEALVDQLQSSDVNQSYNAADKLARVVKNSSDQMNSVVIDGLVQGLQHQDAAVAYFCALALQDYVDFSLSDENESMADLITPEHVRQISLGIVATDTALADTCFVIVNNIAVSSPEWIDQACVSEWMQQAESKQSAEISSRYANLLRTLLNSKYHGQKSTSFEPTAQLVDALINQATSAKMAVPNVFKATREIVKKYNLQPNQVERLSAGVRSSSSTVARGCLDVLSSVKKDQLTAKAQHDFESGLKSDDDYVFAKSLHCLARMQFRSFQKRDLQRLVRIMASDNPSNFYAATSAWQAVLNAGAAFDLVTPQIVEDIGDVLLTSFFVNPSEDQALLSGLVGQVRENTEQKLDVVLSEVKAAFKQRYEGALQQLKNISLPAPNGQDPNAYTFLDLSARPVTLVVFWGTWCEPCKNEIPYLNDLLARIPNVQIKSFDSDSLDEFNEAWDALSTKPTYPVLVDVESKVADAFFVNSYPTVFVFDNSEQFVGVLEAYPEPLEDGQTVQDNPCVDALQALLQSRSSHELN